MQRAVDSLASSAQHHFAAHLSLCLHLLFTAPPPPQLAPPPPFHSKPIRSQVLAWAAEVTSAQSRLEEELLQGAAHRITHDSDSEEEDEREGSSSRQRCSIVTRSGLRAVCALMSLPSESTKVVEVGGEGARGHGGGSGAGGGGGGGGGESGGPNLWYDHDVVSEVCRCAVAGYHI